MNEQLARRSSTVDAQLNRVAAAFFAMWAEKSVGLAVALGVLFGPIGLLYVSPVGAGVMVVSAVGLALAPATVAVPALVVACGMWAGLAARHHNAVVRRSCRPPAK